MIETTDDTTGTSTDCPRWLVPLLGVLVLLFTAPALTGGFHLDDWHQLEVLKGDYEFTTGESPYIEFFTFATGDQAHTQQMIDRGVLPWWTSDDLRLKFLRPVSVLTHQVDLWLWPGNATLAHAHSIFWFLLCLYGASLVYRRCCVTTAGVCLAITAFAFDDSHATTIYWLANRNHLVAGTFVVFAFNEHIKWQTNGTAKNGILAALLFAIGMLSAELAAAYGGLVLAWAIFLHNGSWKAKIGSILPGAAVGIVWFSVYSANEFGARFSGQYVDPAGDPGGFIVSVLQRIPLFFSVVMGLGSLDLYSFSGDVGRFRMWVAAIIIFIVTSLLMIRVGRRDRHLGFWLAATLIAMLPICAGNLMDRVLLLVTFAGNGMLGRLFSLFRDAATQAVRNGLSVHWRRLYVGVAAFLLLSSTVGPPGLLLFRTFATDQHRQAIESAILDIDAPPNFAEADLIIVNPPDTLFTWHLQKIRKGFGKSVPRRLRILGSAHVPLTLERTEEHTLVVRPHESFIHTALSDMYRNTPLTTGWKRSLTGLDVCVTDAGPEGDPLEICYSFDQSIDSPNLVWVVWESGRFVRFIPPHEGAVVELPVSISRYWMALNPINALLDIQSQNNESSVVLD